MKLFLTLWHGWVPARNSLQKMEHSNHRGLDLVSNKTQQGCGAQIHRWGWKLKACKENVLHTTTGVHAYRLKPCWLFSMYGKSALQSNLNLVYKAVDWSLQAVSIYGNAPSNMTWKDTEIKPWLTTLFTKGSLFLIEVTSKCSSLNGRK